jgi:tripeptidyl-peptidase-2
MGPALIRCVVGILGLLAIGNACGQVADSVARPAFPVDGLLPKVETGAARFLTENPEYDGRGIVVAIFDTGVDPGAEGLQTTSDGRPKILDIIDASGSGDIAMTETRTAAEGKIEGLTGRLLQLPEALIASHPDREFRVGQASAYQLFPEELVERMQAERTKLLAVEQHKLETRLRDELRAWKESDAAKGPDYERRGRELEARLEQARLAWENFEDPGPVLDCVVYHDGQRFRALIDTDADGDLTEEKPLTDFDVEREYDTFGFGSGMNFGVHVYDEGKTLSIVCDCGAHGTHVAGIVAGYFETEPELSGIAPGAQIISVKIGDTRLGSMETGRSLVRALAAAKRHGVDLVNMSYGEPSARPAQGPLAELFSELVEKHDIIFVGSAGNAGPALSTVGAPGGTCRSLLGIGAYVSPAMMAAEYSIRESLPENAYTWSSRGPTFDGDEGVDLFAPGGAIAPVPAWTRNRNERMNGTSMASPNACGAIALVLSGLKAQGIEYSPASVERALKTTAKPIELVETSAQGRGLIQVDRAFTHLLSTVGATAELVPISMTLLDRNDARGLVLREPFELDEPFEGLIDIRPGFRDDTALDTRRSFQLRLQLSPTQPWVAVGSHAILAESGRTISFEVDPRGLEPGVHTAEILAFDEAQPNRGPLARFPITVLLPSQPDAASSSTLSGTASFAPGQIERLFLAIPQGATWADVHLTLAPCEGTRQFVLHGVEQIEGRSYEQAETQEWVQLAPASETVVSLPVAAGRALELCLAQNWSSLGKSDIAWRVEYRGLLPDDREIVIPAGAAGQSVTVASLVGRERLHPEVKLMTLRRLVAPSKSTLEPLTDPRDQLTDGRQLYRLILEYPIAQDSAGEITPHWPEFDNLLYESPTLGLYWLLDDANGRLVAAGDPYPKSVSLEPGDHTLRLELRHVDVDWLDSQRSLPLSVDRDLKRDLSLSCYPDRASAVEQADALRPEAVQQGEQREFFIAAPPAKDWPSEAQPGDQLLGVAQFTRRTPHRAGDGQRPGGWPVVVTLGPTSEEQDKEESKPRPWSSEELAQRLFEQRVKLLESIPAAENELFTHLVGELLRERPHDLSVLRAQLQRLDDAAETRKEHLPEIIALTDRMIDRIDPQALREWKWSRKEDAKPTALDREREQHEQWLIDTMYRKCRAIGYTMLDEVLEKHPVEDIPAQVAAYEKAFDELARWTDTTSERNYLVHVRRDRQRGDLGLALAMLMRYLPDLPPQEMLHEKRHDLFEELDWPMWKDYEANWLLIRFPTARQPL